MVFHGVDVVRAQWFEKVMNMVKEVRAELNRDVAIMLDTKGRG